MWIKIHFTNNDDAGVFPFQYWLFASAIGKCDIRAFNYLQWDSTHIPKCCDRRRLPTHSWILVSERGNCSDSVTLFDDYTNCDNERYWYDGVHEEKGFWAPQLILEFAICYTGTAVNESKYRLCMWWVWRRLVGSTLPQIYRNFNNSKFIRNYHFCTLTTTSFLIQ